LFESLEKCAIKELEFCNQSDTDSETMKKILKVQEKNLKKLTIETDHSNLLNDLKELRLEHLEYVYSGRPGVLISLEFFKRQESLKFLKLRILDYSEEQIKMIWELKNS
jgi:histone acetyltransferase (RNA polymerase elongator complex component)